MQYSLKDGRQGKKTLILLFIKAPASGQVKARLAVSIGEENALELYKNFVLDFLETLRSCRYPFRICFSPPEAETTVAEWLGPAYRYEPQQGKDLGERMEHSFREAFSEGHDQVVLVGSDIPDLPVSVFDEAFGAFNTSDMAIGPADDGGYYLLGLTRKSLLPGLFQNIPWSTSSVFQETIKAALHEGLIVHHLPHWRDVDDFDDLQDLFIRNRRTVFSRSRTIACLYRLVAENQIMLKRPDVK